VSYGIITSNVLLLLAFSDIAAFQPLIAPPGDRQGKYAERHRLHNCGEPREPGWIHRYSGSVWDAGSISWQRKSFFKIVLSAGWRISLGLFSVVKGRLNRRAGRRALELLANGQALIIYPEGRRSVDGKTRASLLGAVLLSVKCGVPIVPVGISGTRQLVGKKWFLRRPKITFNIGQPFTLSASRDKLSKRRDSPINPWNHDAHRRALTRGLPRSICQLNRLFAFNHVGSIAAHVALFCF